MNGSSTTKGNDVGMCTGLVVIVVAAAAAAAAAVFLVLVHQDIWKKSLCSQLE